jgi:hypothetical protein
VIETHDRNLILLRIAFRGVKIASDRANKLLQEVLPIETRVRVRDRWNGTVVRHVVVPFEGDVLVKPDEGAAVDHLLVDRFGCVYVHVDDLIREADMGVHENIGSKNFPKQGAFLGKQARVCFAYQTDKTIPGTIVRHDEEEPFEIIIALEDGRYVRAVECQYTVD